MRRLLSRIDRVDVAIFLVECSPLIVLLCVLAFVAFASSCTPPRTVEHAPDLATAGPKRDPVPVTAELLIDATVSSFASLATNLSAPVRPATGWPHGAVTWRPDWSLGRATGSYGYVMHRSVCETRIVPVPMLHHGHREPVVGEQVQVQALTAALAAPSDWPAVLLMEPDGAGLDGDLSPFGLTGCRLAVDLSRATMLWPGTDPANLLYRAPGTARLHLQWTPTDEWAGRSVVCQLLVFVPRDVAPSGMIVSGGLRITVGRK